MKKLITLIIICLYYCGTCGLYAQSTYSNADDERWDAKNYSYSNYTFGFGWSLPKDFEWEKELGHEKHTPFRAAGGPFVVFVNAQRNNNGSDLWPIYDRFIEAIEASDTEIEKRTGQMVYERTFEKCTLLGKHAIKTTFKEYFKDSRFNNPIENFASEYFIIVNGYTLIVAVKLPLSVYNEYECDSMISNIFKGFRLSVAQ